MILGSITRRVSMLAVLGLLPAAFVAGETREQIETEKEGIQLIRQLEEGSSRRPLQRRTPEFVYLHPPDLQVDPLSPPGTDQGAGERWVAAGADSFDGNPAAIAGVEAAEHRQDARRGQDARRRHQFGDLNEE